MVALLPQLIKFRSLANELDDTEFDHLIRTFIDLMMNRCGRRVIVTGLFAAFTEKSGKTCKMDAEALTQINEIIEGIIENREETPDIDDGDVSLRLDLLPGALIGELASWLPQRDYVALSVCSRSTYRACNNPTTLRELDFTYKLTDYLADDHRRLIFLERYSKITKLSLNISEIRELRFSPDHLILPHLFSLKIRFGPDCDLSDIEYLIDDSVIRWDRITRLQLVDFGDNTVTKDEFLKVLSIFPRLQFLRLDNINVDHHFESDDDSIWDRMLPELRTFFVDGKLTSLVDSIIRSRGHQLETVTLTDVLSESQDFGSLINLDCYAPLDGKTLNTVLRTAGKLKQVYFDLEADDDTLSDTFNLIASTVSKQRSLEHVTVWLPMSKLEGLSSALGKGVFCRTSTNADVSGQATSLKSESLVIELLVGNNEPFIETDDVVFQLSGILMRLNESCIDDFCLSVNFCKVVDPFAGAPPWNDQDIHRLAEKFGNLCPHFDVTANKAILMIRAKGSKLDFHSDYFLNF